MPTRSKYYYVDEAAKILDKSLQDVRTMLINKELIGHKSKRRWLIDKDQPAFVVIIKREVQKEEKGRDAVRFYQSRRLEYIKDFEHQERLFDLISSVKESIYIATADLKNLFIKKKPIIDVFRNLVQNHIYVRLVCSSPRERIMTEILNDKLLNTSAYFRCTICPRNHMKMFIFDDKLVYIGSANLTNAAMGGKKEEKRNFESGLLTNDETIVKSAMEHYVEVWCGCQCSSCQSAICHSSPKYNPDNDKQ